MSRLKQFLLLACLCQYLPGIAQRCQEFEQATKAFNASLRDAKKPDGSISLTPSFQKNNLRVIAACNGCLSNTDQAANAKNLLVFHYTLGLHYYYDLKFELALEQLNSCLNNPRSKDFIPQRKITYEQASRNLIKEMRQPTHRYGTKGYTYSIAMNYDGKGGIETGSNVEEGIIQTDTTGTVCSEDKLIDLALLVFTQKDSTKAIQFYQAKFGSSVVRYNFPTLTIYHTDPNKSIYIPRYNSINAIKRIGNNNTLPAADSFKNEVLEKYPMAALRIRQLQNEIDSVKAKIARLEYERYRLERGIDSVLNFLNSRPEVVTNYRYGFDTDFGNEIVIETKGSRQKSYPTVVEKTVSRDYPGSRGWENTSFLNFLSGYFQRNLDDSSIITIHVIDSDRDTTSGRNFFLETARKTGLPAPSGSAGFFDAISNSIVVWKPTGTGTLTHELTHAYLSSSFSNCPRWLNEGIASLFEEFNYLSDSNFIPLDNWRSVYIDEYHKVKKSCLPLTAILADTAARGVMEDLMRKCFARYFCIYLKEKEVLPQTLKIINDAHDPDIVKLLCSLLKFSDPQSLQNDWNQWLDGRIGYVAHRFDNLEYRQRIRRAINQQ